MRPMLTAAIVVAVFLIASAVYAAALPKDDPDLNLDLVKRAIRMVENWDGRAVGASGELGPYQIRPAVWLQHSEKPLGWAYGSSPAHRAEQERVAEALIDWIAERLHLLHLPRTAKSIALVFTTGYGNVEAGIISRAKRNYAQRVQNLYDDLSKSP